MGGNPRIDELGIAQDNGAMEGKEVRLGAGATDVYKRQIVLNACTGKNDKAATMKITANVITPNVNVSVFNVTALSGIIFFCASKPAMATCPTIGMKRLRINTIPHVQFQK